MAEHRRQNDFLCFLLKITKIRSRVLRKVPLFSAAPSWGIYFANILLSPTPDTSYVCGVFHPATVIHKRKKEVVDRFLV